MRDGFRIKISFTKAEAGKIFLIKTVCAKQVLGLQKKG
jgi:hypothetical protein